LTLAGRRVLVVGASAGIGRAFALAAAQDGAAVVLSARRADRLAEAIDEMEQGTAAVGDVRNEDDCASIVATAVETMGQIDLVFYAAGCAPLRALIDTDGADWHDVLETNVIGLQQVTRAAVPHMTPGGIVAVLSSETVGKPRTGLGAYGASKAALEQSLRSWRLEHPDLRFSCLAVGATQPTEFGSGYDMKTLVPAMESWTRHGLMQEQYMHTSDVSDFFVAMLGAALAHPGIAVEDLTLRSPSPVMGPPDKPR
jgi:NADP-dependent 3-hydroxy acid dehydrogenase YdfG